MKALPKGVAVTLQLSADKEVVRIAGVYSPGVETPSGLTESWVFWEVSRALTADGSARVWSAFPNRRLESGLMLPLCLDAFNGSCQIATLTLSDLLVGIGLGGSLRSRELLGFTTAFVDQVDSEPQVASIDALRDLSWFLSPEVADKAKVSNVGVVS